MDKPAFFAWLAKQERRYELVDGSVRPLPLVTASHCRISMNILRRLVGGLDRDLYDVCASTFALDTGQRTVRFADGLVLPFKPNPTAFSTAGAVFVYEVASMDTLHVDFGPKVAEYGNLPDLRQYVVASDQMACVWSWVRDDNGKWPIDPEIAESMSASVQIKPFGLSLRLADVYARVNLISRC